MVMKADKLEPQVLEYLMKRIKTADDIFGDSGAIMELKKALTSQNAF